jgi:MATE family multidrug resistance protein
LALLYLLFASKKTPIQWSVLQDSLKNKKWYSFNRQIIKLGIPTGLQYFFEVAAFAVAAMMAGWLGSKQLAAHQLAITLASLTYMIASGIAAGGSISVATAVGNKNWTKAKRYGQTSHVISLITMTLFAVLFLILNKPLAAIFSEDLEVVAMGAQLLILAAIFQLGDGFQAVSVGLLRGLKDVNLPSLFTFIVYWIIAVPLGYVLSKADFNPLFTGVNGIWIGLATGLTISAMVLSFRFYYLLRNK